MVAIRRPLIAVVLLAAGLHAYGIANSILPAQDGLKFIRIARDFQNRSWFEVVRASDQHPLYPALTALTEPIIRALRGSGPDTWRIAAQVVSALASIALLYPLHRITRSLFNERIADLAALGFVLLPFPMEVGHDTLSDATALLAFALSLMWGLDALKTNRRRSAAACGIAAGLGFLSRPEVLIAPFAVLAVGAFRSVRLPAFAAREHRIRLGVLSVSLLFVVGAYSLVKGEVSERLAIRESARLRAPGSPKAVKSTGHTLPPGLDDPRWDFSPKEEPASVPHRSLQTIARDLIHQWTDGLGSILAFFAVWGLVRDRAVRRFIGDDSQGNERSLGRWVLFAYLILFAAVLMRHESKMGYLSSRHVLTLVIIALPWAAAAVYFCGRRFVETLRIPRRVANTMGASALALAVLTSFTLQAKASHPTRWGHRAAGLWLASIAKPGEALLDTRGWAAFVSKLPSYDYWHIRQALTDDRLTYIVVGRDELEADSPRGATLRAWLGYTAKPIRAFPEREGDGDRNVLVYRYERPESWEGLQP